MSMQKRVRCDPLGVFLGLMDQQHRLAMPVQLLMTKRSGPFWFELSVESRQGPAG